MPPIYGPDWTSHHFQDWQRWLGNLAGRPCSGVEIGSFEGRSARWFMETICLAADSRLTCIDPFDFGGEHATIAGGGTYIDTQFDWAEIRRRFEHNLQPWITAGRLRLMAADSRSAFAALAPVPQFDFAYVDGSHIASACLQDAVLVWPRLYPGGILIFDDYTWSQNRPPPPGVSAEVMRPKIAIDAWLQIYEGQYSELEIRNDQVKVRKH
jgi:predicted O-methyltransferase YrrM